MFTTDTLLESTGLPERTRKDVPRIVNRLLGQTFLYQDVEADKDDYYTVSRHRPVFEAAWGWPASRCCTTTITASSR